MKKTMINKELIDAFLAFTEVMKGNKSYPKKLIFLAKLNHAKVRAVVEVRDEMTNEQAKQYKHEDGTQLLTEEIVKLNKEIEEIDNQEVEIDIQMVSMDDLPDDLTPKEVEAFGYMVDMSEESTK